MGQNPFNLTLRFILELAALYFIGRWGWTQFDSGLRYLPVIGLPLLAAVIWGTFRVPGDGGAPQVRHFMEFDEQGNLEPGSPFLIRTVVECWSLQRRSHGKSLTASLRPIPLYNQACWSMRSARG